LTVPVSLSSLLFPTVPPRLSFSLLSFASVVCGVEGAGAGCWGSGCCADVGEAAINSAMRSETTICRCIPFRLLIVNSNCLLGRYFPVANAMTRFHYARSQLRFTSQRKGFTQEFRQDSVIFRTAGGRLRQLFFLSIFRFKTMSLRLSKLETVRVCDLEPSFSACNS